MSKNNAYPIIESERAKSGMTRSDLCEKLGVTLVTYQRWQRGSKLPVDKALELSKLFNVTLDYLVGRKAE